MFGNFACLKWKDVNKICARPQADSLEKCGFIWADNIKLAVGVLGPFLFFYITLHVKIIKLINYASVINYFI